MARQLHRSPLIRRPLNLKAGVERGARMATYWGLTGCRFLAVWVGGQSPNMLMVPYADWNLLAPQFFSGTENRARSLNQGTLYLPQHISFCRPPITDCVSRERNRPGPSDRA